MHFMNVSNHYECSIKGTLRMLVMNVFNHLGEIIYDRSVEYSLKCTLEKISIIRNVQYNAL